MFSEAWIVDAHAREATSVHVADFDADGDLDILAASDAIRWYESGIATWVAHDIVTNADPASTVHAGDFDGDGLADVVSAWVDADEIAWYRNEGNGGFGSRQVMTTSDDGPYYLLAVDLDGDGDTDVLSASAHDDRVAWHENTGGTFAPLRTIGTGGDLGRGGGRTLHAADVDGDGDLDVLAAEVHSHRVSWYENTGGGGFSERRVIGEAANAAAVHAADLDGDGDLDVVAAAPRTPPWSSSARADEDSIIWFRNEGGGVFSDPNTVAASPSLAGASDIYPADLDGDGDVDVAVLAAGDARVAWIENLGGVFSDLRVISTSQTAPWSLHAADLDADGDLDLVVASQGDNTVAWYENLGLMPPARPAAPTAVTVRAGIGALEVAWQAPPDRSDGTSDSSPITRYMVLARSPRGAPGGECFVPAEATGCVVNDLLPGATYMVTVHAENAHGIGPGSDPVEAVLPSARRGELRFSRAQAVDADARQARSVHAADFDGDGDLDVLAAADAIKWYERNDQAWVGHVVATEEHGTTAVHAADLDADGLVDVISARVDDDEIAWFRNGGAGVFGPRQSIHTYADGPYYVLAGDVDDDGDTDVLSASAHDDRVAWYANTSGEMFSPLRIIGWEGDLGRGGGRTLHAADVNGDGDLDVVVAEVHSHTVSWYENTGGGWYSQRHVIGDVVNAAAVHAADIDGDGDLDVVAAAPRTPPWSRWPRADEDSIVWFRNEGAATFTEAKVVAASPSLAGASDIYPADMDGDGDADIAVLAAGDARVSWMENLGGGVFGRLHIVSTTQAAPWSMHAADLDADGDIDLVVASKDDNTVAWYENLGRQPSAPSVTPPNVRAVGNLGSIAVSWRPVEVLGDGGSPVTRYVVVAVPAFGSAEVTCSGTADEGCTLENLVLGMAYSITVMAENEFGMGPASQPMTARAICEHTMRANPVGVDGATISVATVPAATAGEPRRPATATFQWSAEPEGAEYAITVDDEAAFACPADGLVGDGAVETTLVAICNEPGDRTVGVDIDAGGAVANLDWRVDCKYGNATVAAVEQYQGPMARSWYPATGEQEHVPLLAKRSAIVLARIAHDSPAPPELSVAVRDLSNPASTDYDLEADESLYVHTLPPSESPSGLWETEQAFSLPGERRGANIRATVTADPGNLLDETDETDNVTVLDSSAKALRRFRIKFVPIRSQVGEPAAIDPEAYMTRIYDLFPLADDYEATTGHVFAFDDAWDQHDATVALLHEWETEADEDEYWHGVYKYPWDGSSCGYAFLGRPVSIAAGMHDGCTPNINAHEVGHSLSLRHPRDGCGAGNADQEFPYDGAGIGPRRGWLFSESRFVNPNDGFADTMSYCGPDYYISDYHYRKAFDHRRARSTDASDETDDPADAMVATVAGDPPDPPDGSSTRTGVRRAAQPDRAPRSLVLTGDVDSSGTWSVRLASLSTKPPRPSHTSADRHVLVLVDRHGIEIQRQSFSLYRASHGDTAAWTVRMATPGPAVAFVEVQDSQGNVLLQRDMDDLPTP